MDLEKEPIDKSDRSLVIKEQVSRIYMKSIAANEREDRLLSRKLDAIDMEHRSQFLKMKKRINNEKIFSEKRLPVLHLERTVYNERKSGTRLTIPVKIPSRDLMAGSETTGRLVSVNDSRVHETEFSKGQGNKAFERSPGLIKDRPDELSNRLKYTEKEVTRIRKSWAGQNTPPQRKRTFLPHLENAPEPPLSYPGNTGLTGRNGRPTHRSSCYEHLIAKTGREKSLPEIVRSGNTAGSLPSYLERRKTIAASRMKFFQEASAEFSRSLPKNL
eukprot:Seg4299.2 transcript_id=Seg4299.2/GoldUCD/mRNA.D3Y31 product="hypothetical protein" protein_id=Seg4299.2/GoldUCD/D3Y31